MSQLAAAFKTHKANSGMTYDQLAEATGLSRQTLLNIAAGRTYGDLRTWLILARVWGRSLAGLTDAVWDLPGGWQGVVPQTRCHVTTSRDDRNGA